MVDRGGQNTAFGVLKFETKRCTWLVVSSQSKTNRQFYTIIIIVIMIIIIIIPHQVVNNTHFKPPATFT
jgi:hypothetical protein